MDKIRLFIIINMIYKST